jgi:hypothetical protein
MQVNFRQKDKLGQLIESWDNKEKAQAIKVLKESMVKSSSVNRTTNSAVHSYVKNTIEVGLKSGRLLDYPEDFSLTAKNTYYKSVIQAAVKELADELGVNNKSDTLTLAWDNLEKSKNLVEFRKNLKMYISIMKGSFYTEDDVMELTCMIDERDKEIDRLKEYQRIYNEIFGILSQDDEELSIVLKDKTLKSSGFTDVDICKVLGIKRNRLNYLRSKHVVGNEC